MGMDDRYDDDGMVKYATPNATVAQKQQQMKIQTLSLRVW
jgi:hypothetical protein